MFPPLRHANYTHMHTSLPFPVLPNLLSLLCGLVLLSDPAWPEGVATRNPLVQQKATNPSTLPVLVTVSQCWQDGQQGTNPYLDTSELGTSHEAKGVSGGLAEYIEFCLTCRPSHMVES